jgi:hypothetical protein
MFGTFLIASAAILTAVGNAGSPRPSASDPQSLPAGVALLSSSLGGDVSVREVTTFVKTHHINPVVIDFAWITHHWPRTKLAEVERLARALRADGVSVAAMYRPRGLRPSDAPVHWAQKPDGTVPNDHVGLCFAHADSVRWGSAWPRRWPTCWSECTAAPARSPGFPSASMD